MASDVSQRAREALDAACDGLVAEVAAMINATPEQRRALSYAEAEMRGRIASLDIAALVAETALPPILIDPTGKGYPTDERPMTVAEFEAVIRADATAIERERCAGVAGIWNSHQGDQIAKEEGASPRDRKTARIIAAGIVVAIRKGPTP